MSPVMVTIAAFALLAPVWSKDKVDPRILKVRSVFVSGNNQAAEEARKQLAEKKSCLVLATKGADADATLDLAESATGTPGVFGTMGARNAVVSATLTLSSGDLIWSRSERWGDRPGKSGAKIAGDVLVKRLAKDACGEK